MVEYSAYAILKVAGSKPAPTHSECLFLVVVVQTAQWDWRSDSP